MQAQAQHYWNNKWADTVEGRTAPEHVPKYHILNVESYTTRAWGKVQWNIGKCAMRYARKNKAKLCTYIMMCDLHYDRISSLFPRSCTTRLQLSSIHRLNSAMLNLCLKFVHKIRDHSCHPLHALLPPIQSRVGMPSKRFAVWYTLRPRTALLDSANRCLVFCIKAVSSSIWFIC